MAIEGVVVGFILGVFATVMLIRLLRDAIIGG